MSVGDPRFVIVAGLRALAAFEHMAWRTVGQRRAGQVGLMFLLPRPLRLVARRRRHRTAMQPAMPFGRNLGGLGRAVIEHPAPFAVVQETLAAEIAIAIAVGA